MHYVSVLVFGLDGHCGGPAAADVVLVQDQRCLLGVRVGVRLQPPVGGGGYISLFIYLFTTWPRDKEMYHNVRIFIAVLHSLPGYVLSFV